MNNDSIYIMHMAEWESMDLSCMRTILQAGGSTDMVLACFAALFNSSGTTFEKYNIHEYRLCYSSFYHVDGASQ